MTHLLQEVKEELDWAARELAEVESQFIELEKDLRAKLDGDSEANIAEIARLTEEQKKSLNINELHSILSRAARRFSLLAHVFEIGAANTKIEDIVAGLMDGLVFRQSDANEGADEPILQLAEALQYYFQIRDAWMEVQGVLHRLGRKL